MKSNKSILRYLVSGLIFFLNIIVKGQSSVVITSASSVNRPTDSGSVYFGGIDTEFNNARKIVRDSAGHLYFAYSKAYNNYSRIFIAKSTDTGINWQEIGPIEDVGNYDQFFPSLAIDSNDNLHCVWCGDDENSGGLWVFQIKYSSSLPGGYKWSKWRNIQPSLQGYYQSAPALAVDRNNNLHCVWEGTDPSNPNHSQIKYSSSPPDGSRWSSWKNIQTISSYYQCSPSLVIDSNNNLHCIWTGCDISHPSYYQIKYSSAHGGGFPWSNWINIQPISGYMQEYGCLVIDSNDNLHYVWCGYDSNSGSKRQVKYSSAPPTGYPWSNWQNIYSDLQYHQDSPVIAIDVNNVLHCLWCNMTPDIAYICYSKNGGSGWSTPENLTSGIEGSHYFPTLRWSNWHLNNGTLNFGWIEQIGSIHRLRFMDIPSIKMGKLPKPPSDLHVEQLSDKRIKLIWKQSETPEVAKYNIYGDNASSMINYTSPIDSVLHPTTYWISPALELNKTYKFAVRAEDKWCIEEKNTDYVSISILPPQPPRNLTVKPLKEKMIELSWDISPSTDVMKYNIYWDGATSTINYSSPIDSVLHPTTYWISPALELNKTYKFAVRAEDKTGFEEQNSNFVTISPIESLNTLKAAIKIPQNGKRISGNRVLVYAEIVSGNPVTISKVLFQYKSTGAVAWQNIISANINHPNPDEQEPYFIHWDVTELPEGQYELRAVVYNENNQPDTLPGAITIFIDHTTPETVEEVIGNSIVKRETITNIYTNTIKVGDDDSNLIIQLVIPDNVLETDTTIIKVTVNPSNVPNFPRELSSINQFVEFEFDTSQKSFSENLTLFMPYLDIDNDGIIDNTQVYETRLNIYRYDLEKAKWEKLHTTVDIERNICVTQINHLSIFGLFGTASDDINNVLVYPVPYIPYDGIDDNGKPYSTTDPQSGIIFENVPQSVEIEVYSLTGELIWNKYIDKSAGKVRWDVKDKNGNEVTSGGYFAVISDPSTSKKVTRKIAIIR